MMARDALTELCGVRDDEDDSDPTILFTDIRQLFHDRQTDKLWSEEIVSALAQMENRPWPEWKSGKPITQRQLAQLLKPFKIESKDIKKLDNTVKKGYRLDQFRDAFQRYLPPASATSATARKNKDLTGFESATELRQVAHKKAHIPHPFSEVAQVADSKGGKAKRI